MLKGEFLTHASLFHAESDFLACSQVLLAERKEGRFSSLIHGLKE